MSPEMLLYTYDEKTDLWSLGVLLHVMVSGYFPFGGKTHAEMKDRIKSGHFHFEAHKEF